MGVGGWGRGGVGGGGGRIGLEEEEEDAMVGWENEVGLVLVPYEGGVLGRSIITPTPPTFLSLLVSTLISTALTTILSGFTSGKMGDLTTLGLGFLAWWW